MLSLHVECNNVYINVFMLRDYLSISTIMQLPLTNTTKNVLKGLNLLISNKY